MGEVVSGVDLVVDHGPCGTEGVVEWDAVFACRWGAGVKGAAGAECNRHVAMVDVIVVARFWVGGCMWWK